jgi:DnaK suppressor protein
MEEERARELLRDARESTERELVRVRPRGGGESRDPADDTAGQADDLTDRETDEALAEMLTRRLERIERAEQRLSEGTYGRSVVSGEPIPDARLEIEPWAEQTVAEQSRS